VVIELIRQAPDLRIGGVGGRHLRAAGQEQHFDLTEHAVVGLVDVIKNYGTFRRLFHEVLAGIKREQPRVVVLIDFPGFNLRLARQIRKRFPATKILYYIAPQVWAWKSGRAELMERLVDRVLVIFPFEKAWFNERVPGLAVEWVGHPTLDEWDQSALSCWEERRLQLILLPGSRQKEIEAHLPVFLDGIRSLHAEIPEMEYLLLAADAGKAEWIRKWIKSVADLPPVRVENDYHLSHLSRARLAWVASGTATLECAMAGLPMVVVYKTQPLTWWVGKRLVKLPFLSMVNLVAGKQLVPELLQEAAQPEALVQASLRFLESPDALRQLHTDLVGCTARLRGDGASKNVARAILQEMGESFHLERFKERACRLGGEVSWLEPGEPAGRPFVHFPAEPGAPRLYISAGIHGDEPAGPVACQVLLEERELFPGVEVFMFPCLCPEALKAGKRENPRGIDLNRNYGPCQDNDADVRAHLAVLRQLPRMNAALCLHEDWEAEGVYLYEIGEADSRLCGRDILRAMSPFLPVETAPVIDGFEADRGIILRRDQDYNREDWPEAIYLLRNLTKKCFTIETPSSQDLFCRVQAHVAAVREVVRQLKALKRAG